MMTEYQYKVITRRFIAKNCDFHAGNTVFLFLLYRQPFCKMAAILEIIDLGVSHMKYTVDWFLLVLKIYV